MKTVQNPSAQIKNIGSLLGSALMLALVLAVGLLSQQAKAVWAPGWERPIKEAQMDIVSADGAFETVEAATLTLRKRDGSKEAATSFLLELTFVNTLTGKELQRSFEVPVQKIEYTRCGSTFYTAQLELLAADNSVHTVLELDIERKTPMISGARCGSMTPGPFGVAHRSAEEAAFARSLEPTKSSTIEWVADVTAEDLESGEVSLMNLEGDPEDVMSITSRSILK